MKDPGLSGGHAPRIASLGRFLLLPAGTLHRDVWSLDLGSENATWIQLATDNTWAGLSN